MSKYKILNLKNKKPPGPKQRPEVAQLHRLEGQLHGIEKMISENKPVSRIIQQIEAVQGSLRTLEHHLLINALPNSASNELKDCAKYLARLH